MGLLLWKRVVLWVVGSLGTTLVSFPQTSSSSVAVSVSQYYKCAVKQKAIKWRKMVDFWVSSQRRQILTLWVGNGPDSISIWWPGNDAPKCMHSFFFFFYELTVTFGRWISGKLSSTQMNIGSNLSIKSFANHQTAESAGSCWVSAGWKDKVSKIIFVCTWMCCDQLLYESVWREVVTVIL